MPENFKPCIKTHLHTATPSIPFKHRPMMLLLKLRVCKSGVELFLEFHLCYLLVLNGLVLLVESNEYVS